MRTKMKRGFVGLGYGGFLKWVYPQIINLNRIFHYKPSSYWGIPICGNPHMGHDVWPLVRSANGQDSARCGS